MAYTPPDTGPAFEALLAYVRDARGPDLGGYKRVGLARRVTKRMRAVGCETYDAYQGYLASHPDEFAQLFNAVLINVTAFFRDEQPWEYLRGEVLPRLLEGKPAGDPIRVWCAGCATGEEAYTLAILLTEALGAESFRERVKVYATDVDDDALATARQGAYGERQVEGLSPELLEKYFERQDGRYVFRKDLRRLLIFGRNDLMRDAPISRIDLLTCRNTLMYFDAAAQARVLARLHFALADGGVLVLGRAETLLTHTSLFVPVDLKRRVFVKAPRASAGSRIDPLRDSLRDSLRDPVRDPVHDSLREAAFDLGTAAQLVLDRAGRLVLANGRARALFQLGAADVGRLLQDLELSYRPFDLRSLVDQASAERRPVTRAEVPWRTAGGESRWFDVVVAPLFVGEGDHGAGAALNGVSVTFAEATQHKLLQQQVQESQAELEAAYQELQSTNEELETTNEELHSTVEELETTNEELQSTNEELETMNEELQSTNEELETMNDELRQRSDELDQANSFLETILTSLRAGVAVLDRALRVMVWNSRAEDMWGLRADEVVGLHFLNLDIGLRVERLADAIRAALAEGAEEQEVTLTSTNRRGRSIECRVTVLPLVVRAGEMPRGVIVRMDEQPAPVDAAPATAAV